MITMSPLSTFAHDMTGLTSADKFNGENQSIKRCYDKFCKWEDTI